MKRSIVKPSLQITKLLFFVSGVRGMDGRGTGCLHDGFQAETDDSTKFLSGELERSVADKEDGSSVLLGITSCERCALTSTNRISNTAPQNLADGCNTLGELRLPDTEIRGTSLRNHYVVLFEEFSNARPEPRLGDDFGLVFVLFDFVLHLRPWDGGEFAQVDQVDDFAEHTAHTDAWILRVADDGVSAVEIDCV